MKKRIIFTAVILVLSISFMFRNIQVNAISYKLDNSLDNMMVEFHKQIKENPSLMKSSNPYKFIKDNKAFESIVALGYEALPYINEKVEKSENNGLQEYILAIAAEKIAVVDLKGESYSWDTGKGWSREWKKHLQKLPKEYESITTSNDKDKVSKIVKLGAPAIPYLIDDIEQGNIELIPALKSLIQSNEKIELANEDEKDIKKWLKENKSKFNVLKEIVNQYQVEK